MINILQIPGVLEAIEKERLIRDAAFLPIVEHIAGIPAMPLTLTHYNALRIAGSPMLPPFRVTGASELVAFMWIVSPEYSQDRKARAKFCKRFKCVYPPKVPRLRTRRAMRRWSKRFLMSCQAFSELLVAAREYVEEALMDFPAAETSRGYQPSFYSDICQCCASLAREYGGGIEMYRNMPLKVVFQFMKEIEASNTPRDKLVLFNPLSERAINSYLLNKN